MANTVKIKSTDTAIEFTAALTDNGAAVDLTGASILFLMQLEASPYTAYSLAASIDGTATLGNVKYTVGVGFPTVAGDYKQEWQVTFSGGTILSFPSNGYNRVKILADLN